MRRLLPLVVLLLAALTARAQNPGAYRSTLKLDPPPADFAVPNQLKALELEIEQKKWKDAAARLESILREHGDENLASPAEGLLSMQAWIDGLAPDVRTAISAEYQKQFDDAARLAFEELRKNLGARATEFYEIARTYPLTDTAGLALVEAGDRAAKAGDPAGVISFYTMAQQRTGAQDDERATMLAFCRQLMDQSTGKLSPEVTKRLAAFGDPTTRPYRGPVAFDGTWYGRADGVHMARYFPVWSDGIVYVNGIRQLLAIKENGQVLWSYQGTQPANPINADRPNFGRGIAFAPAVLVGQAGVSIIVIRQQHSQTRDLCLRAIRPDGKLLWTTETNPAVDNIAFISAPAVAGQYVYSMGVDYTPNQPPGLVMVALDVMDGRLLFKTPLGAITGIQRNRQETPAWDALAEQTAPAVGEDLVLVSPNVGWAFAVGRFDGKLRWALPYSKPAPQAVRRVTHKPPTRPSTPAVAAAGPLLPAHIMRYGNTPQVCGRTVVFAPEDWPVTFAADLRTGDYKWFDETPDIAAPTLIGHSDDCAVFSGLRLQWLEVGTGQLRCEWEPKLGQSISGPPAIVGQTIYIPTLEKIQMAALADGSTVDAKIKHPNFRLMVSGDVVKRALDEAGVMKSLGLPGKK